MSTDDLRSIADNLESAGSGRIVNAIEVAMEMYALDALDIARRLMRVRLTPRSGRLIGSLRHSVRRAGKEVTATISSGGESSAGGTVKYAAIHEYGGTVTGSPMLRIPLPPALTGRGVDKMSGLSIRGNDDFRLQPREGKPPVIIHEPSGEPWYVLKRSVDIPPRPTLGPASRFAQRRLMAELEGIGRVVGRP